MDAGNLTTANKNADNQKLIEVLDEMLIVLYYIESPLENEPSRAKECTKKYMMSKGADDLGLTRKEMEFNLKMIDSIKLILKTCK